VNGCDVMRPGLRAPALLLLARSGRLHVLNMDEGSSLAAAVAGSYVLAANCS
jgi:hypothetical protein